MLRCFMQGGCIQWSLSSVHALLGQRRRSSRDRLLKLPAWAATASADPNRCPAPPRPALPPPPLLLLQVSPLAALLFAPTQVWVTIAAKLNWDIVQLNSGSSDSKKK